MSSFLSNIHVCVAKLQTREAYGFPATIEMTIETLVVNSIHWQFLQNESITIISIRVLFKCKGF